MKGKRVLALLLAMGMTVSMAACGGSKAPADNADAPADNGGEATESVDAGEAENVIDMEGDPYTVAIQVVTLPGTQYEGEEDREAAINEITVPAINCKVDIQEVWISEVAQTTSMAVAGNEKLDLLHVATVSPLSSMVGSDMLLDMNEDNLIQTHGADLINLFGEDLMNAGNVDGQQLAVPAKIFNANAKGIYYNKTMADAAGVTLPEKGTLDDLEKAFEGIKAANPDVRCWYSGNGENNYLYWMASYATFGTQSGYGVILDENADELKVENLYASDLYKDYALRMYNWTQKGYQKADPTDTNPAQSYFGAGQLFCVVSDDNEMLRAQYAANNPDIEIGWMDLTDPAVTNQTVTEYMWGIASNSERPDKAMDFLNFLYTNADVANILMYGLEGVNYDFAEGSTDIVVRNGSYAPSFYCGGNESEMYILAPSGEDYVEKRQAMEAEATVSPILGYMFSDADFQTESSMINSTYLEYCGRLANGMCESEEATLALIDEFVAKLQVSGIDDVIAANQEQLDAFLASK